MSDQWLLYLAASVRAFATGMIGVLLGVYLTGIGLGAGTIGVLVVVGLAGAAAGTLLLTLLRDRLGRRRVLLGTMLLSSAGGFALASGSHPLVLGLATLVGMVHGMGRDRGAALVVEHAALPLRRAMPGGGSRSPATTCSRTSGTPCGLWPRGCRRCSGRAGSRPGRRLVGYSRAWSTRARDR